MAQKIQTLFVDDLDGSDAEGTVRFGLDGTNYEIDLSAVHAGELRSVLAPYARAGRMTGIGLWTEAASALASVVRMAQVSSTLLLCFHDSHRAANAMGLPSLDPKKYGFVLLSAFHSK